MGTTVEGGVTGLRLPPKPRVSVCESVSVYAHGCECVLG